MDRLDEIEARFNGQDADIKYAVVNLVRDLFSDTPWLIFEVRRLREQVDYKNDGQETRDLRDHAETLKNELQAASALNAVLQEELDAATTENHSVRVCADHTKEITEGGGCLICDIADLEARNAALVEAMEKIDDRLRLLIERTPAVNGYYEERDGGRVTVAEDVREMIAAALVKESEGK